MLNIGDSIIFELKDDQTSKLKCKAVDLKNQVLYTDYPVYEKTGKTAFLMNGTHVEASFVGSDQNAYFFHTEVLGRCKEKIPMLTFKMPKAHELKRIQRREYVRIETAIDVALHSASQRFMPFVTTTIDISAGGAAVNLNGNQAFEQNEEVTAWFSLPFQKGTIEYAAIKAKMVRVLKSDKKAIATLQFIDLSETDRKKLLQFCFDQELLLKKKKAFTE
jgi:c-di-GMP-binding flagellar brake protein YcgR